MDISTEDVFGGLSIKAVLDADSRPTFVLDLDPDDPSPIITSTIDPIFCNLALKTHERLLDAVLGHTSTAEVCDGSAHGNQGLPREDNYLGVEATVTHHDFKAWATGVTTHDDSKDVYPLSFRYQDLLWTGSTVHKRWRLISGNRQWKAEKQPPLDLSSGTPPEVALGGALPIVASNKTRNPKGSLENEEACTGNDVCSITSGPLVEEDDVHLSPIFYPRQPTDNSGSVKTGNSKSSKNISINLHSLSERNTLDWTAPEPQGRLSTHLEYVRTIDWSATSLGPMDQWSPEFRQIANLVMTYPHPAALFWGCKLTVIYNEAYAADVAGNKHPTLMGTDFADFFAEIWEYCGPLFEECGRTGVSVRKDNDFLSIYRHGMLEETYYSWQYVPVYSSSTQELLGFYNSPFQTTSMVLNQRRMRTVNAVGDHTSSAKTVKQFWKLVLQSLDTNPRDTPFALLYSVGDDDDGEHSSSASDSSMSLKTCHFEGSIGVPDGHIATPQQLDLRRSLEGFVPSFREAMRTREPTLLRVRDGTLPEALLDGIEWRGFGDPCKEAIIFPVRPTNADNVLAFLVLGVNPRRPYDEEYRAFATMLNRQLSTSLASTILFEEDTRRITDAFESAHLEKEKLSQQLHLQASRLRRMTELSPLGMFFISPAGILREANERFFEMTGLPRDSQYELSWMDFIMPNSIKTIEGGWQRLANEHQPWSGEIQLKQRGAKPINPHGQSMEYWVAFIAQPELSSDGSLRSVMGSITDVSNARWAQNLQEHQLREAEETRRQQNEFIDITSHEMRNPLSAILQCADNISTTLVDCLSKGVSPSEDMMESSLESAQTILLCVQHQKSIVDDILTISKLDSNLLLITPIPSQPEQILGRALKMFDSELQAKDIQTEFEVHASYKEHNIDWVNLDPSRVLQILINLLTNAIKFTAPSTKRLLSVAVGASLEPPVLDHIPEFQFAPMNNAKSGSSAEEGWGDGEPLYIRFKVQDTGCGLTDEEKQILFRRFQQASPRTHAQYGGSGLGLFISKRLSELHGGQIGVTSKAGEGSIFAFYVQARRCGSPGGAAVDILPIERHLGGDDGLQQQLAPQRQDIASVGGQGASLVAAKARKKFDPNKITILVVEDNLINQRVLENQLKKIGCKVNLANDGLEALAFLRTTHFYKNKSTETEPGDEADAQGKPLDIILMDLEMPRMDGLTCVSELRKMEASGEIVGHVPVIAVTANVRDQQMATARQSGMDDVLSKPFGISDLMRKVETMLLAGTISAVHMA
ncbi:hypothetical protein N0V82_000162 [Gnomoniopsis sp. IMI 355080]|nr:hypothetical protein N0V82_000162 [Gnomoniopsis sp. IMI 355080]